MDETLLQRIKQRYGVVGNADGLNRALDIALKIAPVDLSVLITGESGVGKEVIPRIIHDHSARKGKRYFAVNCGAIPEGTIDSELFGHEKGAFTGAIDSREGYFSVANGGTLFLDEVGELPMQTQARLLRVLETGEYIRVGASEVRKTDVRIVAATNVNIEKAIEEGRFREDLFYRLNSISIQMPALRHRGTDIVLLFKKFALEMSERYKMPPVRLDDEAKKMLMAYSWPGNVRQLKNITENLSVTCGDRDITPDILREYLPERRSNQLVAVNSRSDNNRSFENEREILYQILFDLRRDVNELKKLVHEGHLHNESAAQKSGNAFTLLGHGFEKDTNTKEENSYCEAEEIDAAEESQTRSLEHTERELIRKTLSQTNGRRKVAAEKLGISERTLYRKIKEYGLE
ncbi:MAG: sigma-54-dependent Fis family transcriptional regulator [Bacteroidaceae bacterium]|nr:sigma-54-dependent Fis family transcriptional regulator [Bacteroidaceae bacterium]MBR5530585.1 sigma-54-dependent Fis family transcriptional regulator [Bacteroidaceae bacterium]